MEAAFKELARIIKPVPLDAVLAALDGEPSLFDIDATWWSDSSGSPRPEDIAYSSWDPPTLFDGRAFRAAMQAIAFLSAMLPVGHPRRRALVGLDAKIAQRLAHPGSMFLCGVESEPTALEGEPYVPPGYEKYAHHQGIDAGGLVSNHGYLYFRPAMLEERDLATCERVSDNFGVYEVWKTWRSADFRALVARIADTPLGDGQFESDPRASCPALVAEVARAFALGESAATVYLQVLALPDCSDVWLRTLNAWKNAALEKAVGELVSADLLEERKEARAGRKAVLPGPWEKLSSPDPGTEQWKLGLLGARTEDKEAISPLDRLLVVQPAHLAFAQAWAEVRGGRGPGSTRAPSASDDSWIAAILAAPHADEPRLVYADHLGSQGDPRGELISLQTRRRQLGLQGGPELEALEAREQELLARWGSSWTERLHPHVEECRFDRGFVTSIRVRVSSFVQNAALIFDAAPLLEELVLHDREGANPIPAGQLRKLANCEHFARIRRLDFTADQYVAEAEHLQTLLQGAYLPELEWLRIGFHRRGEGFGSEGASAIARTSKLHRLRFLEIAGQNLGGSGAEALVDSEVLYALEVLRLPLNHIRDSAARTLLARLQQGRAPALRVLDLGNLVETTFVTKAAQWHENRVSHEVQHQIQRTLAARQGEEDPYTYDRLLDRD